MRFAVLALVTACGSQSGTSASTTSSRGTDESNAEHQRIEAERKQRAEITAKHHKLELAQQDAMGATCDDPAKWAPQHCTPSCYPPEPKDPRAGMKLAGTVELHHHVCQRGGTDAPWLVIEELDAKTLVAKQHKGRLPKPHKKGTWQADVAKALAATRIGKAPRGEVFLVTSKEARTVSHPVSKESLRCVTVAQYTTVPRGELDDCGVAEAGTPVTCEAAGSAAARGVNLARFRIAEAARLRDAGKDEDCRTAALDALATARGLPRWRQYAKLNTGVWKEGMAYKTRFDGIVDEDALFNLAPVLELEAKLLLAACNMVGTPPTKPEHEHAFHSCP